MVTGVSVNPVTTPKTQLPRRTPQSFLEPLIDEVMTEIHNLRTTMIDGVIQPKIIKTQVPFFFREIQRVRTSTQQKSPAHIHKLTKEQKLKYFQSLLRDDAIEFWQTLKINTQTTLTDIISVRKFVNDVTIRSYLIWSNMYFDTSMRSSLAYSLFKDWRMIQGLENGIQ